MGRRNGLRRARRARAIRLAIAGLAWGRPLKMARGCSGGQAMAMADVTIYGAGIFGLSVAWSCVRRGAAVRVIDPYGPGAGSSGGLVGALAPHVPEQWNDKKAFQLD